MWQIKISYDKKYYIEVWQDSLTKGKKKKKEQDKAPESDIHMIAHSEIL